MTLSGISVGRIYFQMSGTRVVSYMEENKIGSLAYIEKINSK
jgi:hypothetical protein